LQRIRARKTEILLFVVLLSCYAYFFPRWADWNQNSRLDLVLAIVDQRSVAIDAYHQNTGDYAYFNGHYYSDKAPGTSFLGVPVYMFFKTLVSNSLVERLVANFSGNVGLTKTLREGGTGLRPDKVYFSLALSFVTAFVVALPSALMAILFYRLVGHFSSNKSYQILMTLAYGLGTIAFPYSGAFYGHQIAASFLFTAFYILHRKKGEMDITHLVLVGFLLAYSVVTEYPVALIAIPLFLYAFYLLSSKRRVAWLVLGGIPPLVLLMLYDHVAFQTVLPIGYSYSALWTESHHTGFMSLTRPRLDALWGISFSLFRGVFFLSPFLLLAVAGLWYFGRERTCRAEFLACLAIVTAFFLFNSSSVMWWGGFAVGPRYLVPMLPFLAFPMIFFLNRHGDKPWVKYVTYGSISVSVLMVWMETISGQSFPYDSFMNPLLDYSLPRALSGDVARNFGMLLGLSGWHSLLPLLALGVGAGWLMAREATAATDATMSHTFVAQVQRREEP
jgi:hypothetical protein